MDSQPEEDRKLPAVTIPQSGLPKRRKDNEGRPIMDMEEVVDVAAALGFQTGDRVEVKWSIADEDPENAHKSSDGGDKAVSVWWPATIGVKLNKFHTLSDEERTESAGCTIPSSCKVPIYQLNYSPLEEFGFDSSSLEDVAFLSNSTLLNLSTEEIMCFRKAGDPSPPPSPIHSDDEEDITVERENDESLITRDFNGPDEIRSYMNELMQHCLKKTGMDKKMSSLPASQQLVIAEKINRAQEAMLENIINETDKMESGSKVITADVVKRCMAQMKGDI